MNGDILAVQFVFGVSGSANSFVAAEPAGGIIGSRFLVTGVNWLMALVIF